MDYDFCDAYCTRRELFLVPIPAIPFPFHTPIRGSKDLKDTGGQRKDAHTYREKESANGPHVVGARLSQPKRTFLKKKAEVSKSV